jgi:uncharacterized protein DUF3224
VPAVAKGTFEVDLSPAPAEADGAVSRFDLRKTFHGDLDGVGQGVMLGGGDPGAGNAGYVAVETFTGRLGDKQGSFALQQFGTMKSGARSLLYEIVPGSGKGDLEGIGGPLELTVDADGTHRYALEYEL